MQADPNFSVIEESDDELDNEAESDMNNTVMRAKQGLAAGSINAPFQDMLELIAFVPSVKRKNMSLASVSTDSDFREQAVRESKLKNVSITDKNVSFKVQSQGLPGNGAAGKDGNDDKTTHVNYRRVVGIFPQIKEAKPEIKRFVGGISKPNRTSLKLPKNSSKLKECSCPGSSVCTFAFTCEGFKKMHLSQKIAFVKSEGLCENCLIKHSGECEFHNRHTCRETATKKHHSYLCPDKIK